MPTNDPQLGEIWFRRVNGTIDARIIEAVRTEYSNARTTTWFTLRHLSTDTSTDIQEEGVLGSYRWCSIERGSVWVDFASIGIRHIEQPPVPGNWIVESHGIDGEGQDNLFLEVFLSRFEPLGVVVEGITDPQDRMQVVLAMAAIIRDRREALTNHTTAALHLMTAVVAPPGRVVKALFDVGPPKSVWDRLLDAD